MEWRIEGRGEEDYKWTAEEDPDAQQSLWASSIYLKHTFIRPWQLPVWRFGTIAELDFSTSLEVSFESLFSTMINDRLLRFSKVSESITMDSNMRGFLSVGLSTAGVHVKLVSSRAMIQRAERCCCEFS